MNEVKMKLTEAQVRKAYDDHYKNGLSWKNVELKYGVYRTTMLTYFALLKLPACKSKPIRRTGRKITLSNEEMLECVIRRMSGETIDTLTLEKRVSGSLMQAILTYFSRGYILGVQDGLKGVDRLELEGKDEKTKATRRKHTSGKGARA